MRTISRSILEKIVGTVYHFLNFVMISRIVFENIFLWRISRTISGIISKTISGQISRTIPRSVSGTKFTFFFGRGHD